MTLQTLTSKAILPGAVRVHSLLEGTTVAIENQKSFSTTRPSPVIHKTQQFNSTNYTIFHLSSLSYLLSKYYSEPCISGATAKHDTVQQPSDLVFMFKMLTYCSVL